MAMKEMMWWPIEMHMSIDGLNMNGVSIFGTIWMLTQCSHVLLAIHFHSSSSHMTNQHSIKTMRGRHARDIKTVGQPLSPKVRGNH
jgi:hypothetical protein